MTLAVVLASFRTRFSFAMVTKHRIRATALQRGYPEDYAMTIFRQHDIRRKIKELAIGTRPGLRLLVGTLCGACNVTLITLCFSAAPARAEPILGIEASVTAVDIPGASAIAQVGTFLSGPPIPLGQCTLPHPIPALFGDFIANGAVLDPNRILVGSRSNFGAPLADGVGSEGSFVSIDPSQSDLIIPKDFAQSGDQGPVGGAVQMFSANSPHWLNGVNNPSATTASYTGVSNPLGLSNNNAFGRIWPANAPFGDTGVGSSSILDPTGLPLKGAPNPLIGGVYVGSLTNRDVVATPQQRQVIPGALSKGAVGTALLGPSPDGTCKAVFAVVTADGAIVQEHTLKGLDGLAHAGTVRPILGRSWGPLDQDIEPRFGVIMNPYIQPPTPAQVVRQLFVSEPFNNTIAVINLVVTGADGNEVFKMDSVTRINSPFLNLPVDLAPVKRDADDPKWASNSTLDNGSDFYVANRGNSTIVRMKQDGTEVAVRRVTLSDSGVPLADGTLNGIATSTDGTTIYVTAAGPGQIGIVLALHAF